MDKNIRAAAHEGAAAAALKVPLTTAEKAKLILADIAEETSTDPLEIFRNIVARDYVGIHGPEHHIIDGAAILVAFRNAGGVLPDDALESLAREALRMPGAMCGLWGVCGAVTAVGAALAIIDGTGPLSNDGTWGEHMRYTSEAIRRLGDINGPRCCKRDGITALLCAIEYINSHYGSALQTPLKARTDDVHCTYSIRNSQCIKDRCPYYA